MKIEGESIHTKYKTEIEVLNLQIKQMKNALSNGNSQKQEKEEEEE